MKILVDADACPVVDLTVREANKGQDSHYPDYRYLSRFKPHRCRNYYSGKGQ